MPEFNFTVEFIPVNFNKPAVLKTKTITDNGVYNAVDDGADGFSSVTVLVSQEPTAKSRIEFEKDSGVLKPTAHLIDIDGATSLAYGMLYNAYRNVRFPADTEIDFSSLTLATQWSMNECFYGTEGIKKADLSGITAIEPHSLEECFRDSSVEEVDLSSLVNCGGSSGLKGLLYDCKNVTQLDLSTLESLTAPNAAEEICKACTSLTSFDLSALKTITGSYGLRYAFEGCTSLTTASLPALDAMTGANCVSGLFKDCTGLTTVSFPALKSTSFGSSTSQFNGMLSGCSNVTVHFPSNLQAVIGSWSSVSGGFSGTNTTVLFDLPATE